ncbi:MAG: hypothetical protein ACREDD_12880 [Methylocella sp.]
MQSIDHIIAENDASGMTQDEYIEGSQFQVNSTLCAKFRQRPQKLAPDGAIA